MEEKDYLTKKADFQAMVKLKIVLGAIALGLILTPLVNYSSKVIQTGEWTIKGQKEFYKTEIQHQIQINFDYNKLKNNYFDSNSTKQDTFNFYMENGLGKDIQFNEPSFKDKERALGRRLE